MELIHLDLVVKLALVDDNSLLTGIHVATHTVIESQSPQSPQSETPTTQSSNLRNTK